MKEKDIFDLLESLERKSRRIDELFDCGDFLDYEISIVWAMIESGYGIDGMDTNLAADILSQFGSKEISKKMAQSRLKKVSVKSK